MSHIISYKISLHVPYCISETVFGRHKRFCKKMYSFQLRFHRHWYVWNFALMRQFCAKIFHQPKKSLQTWDEKKISLFLNIFTRNLFEWKRVRSILPGLISADQALFELPTLSQTLSKFKIPYSENFVW